MPVVIKLVALILTFIIEKIKTKRQAGKTRKAPARQKTGTKGKTRKKQKRVEAYTFGEAQRGRGFPW